MLYFISVVILYLFCEIGCREDIWENQFVKYSLGGLERKYKRSNWREK